MQRKRWRIAVVVALALLFAGCTRPNEAGQPAPSLSPSPSPSPSPPSPSLPADRPCATLSLSIDNATIELGRDVTITSVLHNCGTRALDVGGPLCAQGVSLTIARGDHAWHLRESERAGAANLTAPVCSSEIWGVSMLLASGESLTQTFVWNGTFMSDPCAGELSPETSCEQFAAVARGTHVVQAHALIEGWAYEARANVTLAAAPSTPAPPRCGLSLAVDPPSIAPNESANVTLRYDHCGDRDITFGETSVCGHGNGFRVHALDAANASWRLGRMGAASASAAITLCLDVVPPPRVVFPGGFVEVPCGWNGTLFDGSTIAPAPPGHYTLFAEALTGGGIEVNATIEVRPV